MIGFELDFEIKARFRYRENRGTYPERKNNRRKYRNGKGVLHFLYDVV